MADKKAPSFNTIILGDNGKDELDGTPIAHGEKLEIKWRDGTKTKEAVYVDDHIAYVPFKHRGTDARVYVIGMKARRVKRRAKKNGQ